MSYEPDELYTLRSRFWVGNYQNAISEANSLNRLKPHLVEEKEEFLYRSYIGLGQYGIVLSEIPNNPNIPINKRAIRLLALYHENPANREKVLAEIAEALNDHIHSASKVLQTVAVSIYINEGNINEAFRILHNPSTLEHHSLLVQIYLRLNRGDLAQKQVEIMKSIEEESALTNLCLAWVYLDNNINKPQEAGYIFEELIDKYGSSPSLLTSLGVSKMHQGNFSDAESFIQEALSKSPSDPDALANIIIVSYQLHRSPEVINRYFNQLKNKKPDHPLLYQVKLFEDSFDLTASQIA